MDCGRGVVAYAVGRAAPPRGGMRVCVVHAMEAAPPAEQRSRPERRAYRMHRICTGETEERSYYLHLYGYKTQMTFFLFFFCISSELEEK